MNQYPADALCSLLLDTACCGGSASYGSILFVFCAVTRSGSILLI